jgi:putative transposase
VATAADGTGKPAAELTGLPQAQRERALFRWRILRAYQGSCPLVRVVADEHVPERTLRRWLAAYRAGGLEALARRPRSDRGTRRMPPELRLLTEGLALRRPAPTTATVHRQVAEVAREQGWPVPSYAAVHDIGAVARSCSSASCSVISASWPTIASAAWSAAVKW